MQVAKAHYSMWLGSFGQYGRPQFVFTKVHLHEDLAFEPGCCEDVELNIGCGILGPALSLPQVKTGVVLGTSELAAFSCGARLEMLS